MLVVPVTLQNGRYCIEMKINSLQIENGASSAVIHLKIRAPTNKWQRTSWVFKYLNNFWQDRQSSRTFQERRLRNSLQAEWVMLHLKIPLNRHWKQGVTLCGNKIHRKHFQWKLFQRKTSMMHISAKNRNWHIIPAVDCVFAESLPISKNKRDDNTPRAFTNIAWAGRSHSLATNHGVFWRIRKNIRGLEHCTKNGSDKIRFGFCVDSLAIHNTYEPFKDTPVHKSWTQGCKVTSQSHMQGQTYCVMLGLLMTTSLSGKEVFSQEESAVKREDKRADLSFRRKRTTK